MADRRDADSSNKEPLLSPEHHDLESDNASNEGTGMGQRRKRGSTLERRFTLNRSSKRGSGLRERSLPTVEQSVPEDEEAWHTLSACKSVEELTTALQHISSCSLLPILAAVDAICQMVLLLLHLVLPSCRRMMLLSPLL